MPRCKPPQLLSDQLNRRVLLHCNEIRGVVTRISGFVRSEHAMDIQGVGIGIMYNSSDHNRLFKAELSCVQPAIKFGSA
jgi:hypothetical protein